LSESHKPERFLEHVGIPFPVTGIWYLLPAAVTFGLIGLVPLHTWDYWWHATLGHIINSRAAIPTQQIFLFTAPDSALPPQPWLGQLLTAVGQAAADVYPALILRNVAAAVGVWWMTRIAIQRTGDVRRAALIVLTAVPSVVAGVGTGPLTFGWVLFGASIALGYWLRSGANGWWVLGFPCITAGWANLAPGFPVALCLVVLFGADSLIREGRARVGFWGLALVGSCAAVAATPYGLEIYPRYIDALPAMVTIEPPALASFSTIWLILSLALSGWILATETNEFEPVEGLMVAVFGPAALLFSQATLAWWAVIWVLIATRSQSGSLLESREETRSRRSRANQVAATLGGILLLIVPSLVQPVFAWRTEWTGESPRFETRSRPPMKGVVPEDAPWAAVEILRQRAVLPRLFHAQKYSGFLAYFLLRDRPRPILFTAPPRILGKDARPGTYRLASRRPNVWRGLVHQYDFGAVVLEASSQGRLVKELSSSESWWTIAQKDGYAFFLERTADEHPTQ